MNLVREEEGNQEGPVLKEFYANSFAFQKSPCQKMKEEDGDEEAGHHHIP